MPQVPPPSAAPLSTSPLPPGRWPAAPAKSSLRFVLPVLGLYAVYVGYNTLSHEMWRDELEPLGIVRASSSLAELQKNCTRAQTPMLWYLTLYPLKYASHAPQAMQALHAAFAIAAAFVFLRFSRFTNLQKFLFVLGYFLVYEYAAISRNYVQSVLLAFCICALWPHRARRLLPLCVLVFLLIHTSVLGMFLGVAFSSVLFLEYVSSREFRMSAGPWRPLAGSAIVLLGLGLFVLLIKVLCPPDVWTGKVPTQGFDPDRLMITMQWVGRAFLPVPDLFLWNTNALADFPVLFLVASLAMLAATLLLLSRRPLALALYGAMLLPTLLLGYFLFKGELRHHGHLYVTFICALWIGACYAPREPAGPWGRAVARFEAPLRTCFLYGVFLLQIAVGLGVSWMDWNLPFSQSRAVAQYIRDHGLADKLIMAEPDFGGEPVAIWLDREVYFFRGDRMGTFLKMDLRRFGGRVEMGKEVPLDMEKVSNKIKTQRDALLLTLFPVTEGPTIRRLAAFTGGITDEQYFLYSVRNP